jgi:HK97 family phage prohead protease
MELYRKIHTPQALIKDVSVTSRKVTGYFSSYDNQDSDGDAFRYGAYAKTIKENGPQSRLKRIAYLSQHSVKDVLGVLDVLEEQQGKGLYFEGTIPDTTLGIDTLKLYEIGALKEHSVGVSIVKSQPENGINIITEAKLWEGSVVTWGANEETPFTGFKGMTKEKAIADLDIFTKAMRDGTFTDATFNLLEIQIEQIKSYINSLIEPKQITQEPNADLINYFTTKFN